MRLKLHQFFLVNLFLLGLSSIPFSEHDLVTEEAGIFIC